jgi:signal transduction histidine kinase
MRHANATEMQVGLQKIGGDIELIVEDNGTGMNGFPGSGKEDFGIIGMKERAQGLGGQFEISGIPGKGTVIVARIPAGNNPSA